MYCEVSIKPAGFGEYQRGEVVQHDSPFDDVEHFRGYLESPDGHSADAVYDLWADEIPDEVDDEVRDYYGTGANISGLVQYESAHIFLVVRPGNEPPMYYVGLDPVEDEE